jgi:GH15 family glucan-1,4-alpha-glucosidase
VTRGYKPLAEYGVIGNLETCALVGTDGSIDWCPLATLESSSVFAAILDAEKGGRFSITPAASYEGTQEYLKRTNVLRTTFETESGTVQLTDFMPVFNEGTTEEPEVRALYRQVNCTNGTVELDVEYAPRFGYARAETTIDSVAEGLFASGEIEKVFLSTPAGADFEVDGADARTTLTLEAGDAEWFCLQYGMKAPIDPEGCEEMLERTTEYWRDWVHDCDGSDSTCPFGGYAHELVVRSELVLKLLTYRDTGAIAAAPTTSLPEDIGGVRNWDYRYSWIRDGAFTVQALTNLGHTHEAMAYLNRFLRFTRSTDPAEIKPMYTLEHDATLEEEELDHLEGYKNSRPVRIGNGAAGQIQLDVYGELVLAIYQLAKSDREIAEEDWEAVRGLVEHAAEHWDDRDAGIWELRGEPRHLVHSKVMCWVALDRGLDLARQEGFDAPEERWRAVREEIRETTLERGFDETIGEYGSFTQAFDGDALDATGLLIPLAGFVEWDDPRTQGTIEAIRTHLATDDGLVHRYKVDDGLPGEEGAFVLCSFWLVDALALSGRLEEARELFDSLVEYVGPLGLLSEEIDPETGLSLGNFPQAFSHIGLVNSALYLKQAEEGIEVQPFSPPDAE